MRLENVFKRSLQNVLKTSWRCLEEVFPRRLENVLARRLENVLKTSSRSLEDVWARRLCWSWSRRLLKTYELDKYFRLDQDVLKTPWKRLLKTKTKDVFIKTNVWWIWSHQESCKLAKNIIEGKDMKNHKWLIRIFSSLHIWCEKEISQSDWLDIAWIPVISVLIKLQTGNLKLSDATTRDVQ